MPPVNARGTRPWMDSSGLGKSSTGWMLRSGPAESALRIGAHARIPNGAVLALMFSVMVLLVGLVSEQIATLRFEGRR